MKESELRICNLVTTIFENKPVLVNSIKKHKAKDGFIITIGVEGFNKNSEQPVLLEHVYPIPLTEEWLLKFGFEKIGENYENDWLLIHTHLKTKELHFILNLPNSHQYNITVLNYVHQLQNLYFVLTGEELTIKNV